MGKRPKAVVKEYKGIYELWFGKWVLMGGTSREPLEKLARLMNP
jgi:hypothetical protein